METGEKVIIALVVVVTAVTVISLVGAAIMAPTLKHEMEKPESCGRNCHEMQPYYDSFEVSVHKGIDCHECHKTSKPEIFLFLGEGLQHAEWMVEGKSFEEMSEEVESRPPAAPKSEYCMNCHKGKEARIPTERISDPTISCFKCHPTIEHAKHRVDEYGGYDTPDLKGYECVTCHDDHDVMNVKEETCTLCHPTECIHGG